MQPRRFVIALLVPLLLALVGTLGYHVIQDWPLLDSLYMTVITLTTVGFREIHDLSRAGRIFTMVLALGGVFTLFYAASAVIQTVVRGEIGSFLGSRRMQRSLAEVNDHLIVCGYGRMGQFVCREFSAEGKAFVVIERAQELLEACQLPHAIPLHGDATSDDILKQAGVERARALVSVVASDADNLYITMSSRLLNGQLFIVARAQDEESEKKLLRAGASRVISPYQIGGKRIANAVLRPTVVDFMELVTHSAYLELSIDETQISPGSQLAGSTVMDSRLRQEFGVIIVAVKKASGQMLFNPQHDAAIESGDILVTLGRREDLDRLASQARA